MMTASEKIRARREAGGFLLLLILFLCLIRSKAIADGVRDGLHLCAVVLIPSLFPYMVLSDLLLCCDLRFLDRTLGVPFGKLFRISPCGIRAFLLGILCGFPIGIKTASALFREGCISRSEAERLICISGNASPAFLIAGIGIRLRASLLEGLLLFLTQILVSALIGLALASRAKQEPRYLPIPHEGSSSFSLSDSIRKSGIGMLCLVAAVTFFTGISSLLYSSFGGGDWIALLSSLLEIGGGCKSLASLSSPLLSFCATASLTCFSGVSVHIQSIPYLHEAELPVRKYLLSKMIAGLLGCPVGGLLYLLA